MLLFVEGDNCWWWSWW